MPENHLEACEAYESMGLDRAFERENSETALVCFDMVKAEGQCTGLLERSDVFIDFMNSVREASVRRGGSEPVKTSAL